ncbi:MAG: zinc ribbon domain-containing protein [Desulfobacterales bacterium]
MPIYEIRCPQCGFQGELLVPTTASPLQCPSCGGGSPEKQIALTSSLSGANRRAVPGPRDHGCCGARPADAGCAGPGSCCGRAVSPH